MLFSRLLSVLFYGLFSAILITSLIQSQKHSQRRTLPPQKRMLQMHPVKFQHIKKEEILPEENEIKARAKTIPSKKKKQTLLIRKICFI